MVSQPFLKVCTSMQAPSPALRWAFITFPAGSSGSGCRGSHHLLLAPTYYPCHSTIGQWGIQCLKSALERSMLGAYDPETWASGHTVHFLRAFLQSILKGFYNCEHRRKFSRQRGVPLQPARPSTTRNRA